MMTHSLRKEAAADLCEAMKARIDAGMSCSDSDDDRDVRHPDDWSQKRRQGQGPSQRIPLRADRWFQDGPPGTQDGGGFELGLDNAWYCRVLLLFKIKSQTDSGLKEFECAYVSVLEQYTGCRAPGMLILAYFGVFLIIFDYFSLLLYSLINRSWQNG
jgi:hypothetical protein